MTSATPYIVGVDPAMIANPAPRLEIREFVKSPERLTLFVRAFTNIQARPATRSDSYARIASIHGSPVPFDGVNPFPDDDFRGYCQHGSQLFGPWHRPYILMLEMELYKEVNRLAAEYPSPSYQDAAKAFRFPYWDWGVQVDKKVPDILSAREVQITLPNATKPTSVPNPLFSFSLTRNDRILLSVPRYLGTTVRQPSVANGRLVTNNNAVEADLDQNVPGLRSSLTLLLKNPASYPCASNHSAKPELNCSQEQNIESIHDDIHGAVGGNGGHMSSVEYAAFDPAFWLHHCNVDRLLALWEGIYPTEKISEGLPEGGVGVGSGRPSQEVTSSTDPFYPFCKSANRNDWWTAQDVMAFYDPKGTGTRRLGYYYPEFQDSKVTPAQLLAKVDDLYNDNPDSRRVFLNLPAIDTSRIPGSFNLRVNIQPDAPPVPGTRALPMGPVHAGTVCLFKRLHPSRCDHCSRTTPLHRANLDITDALAKIQRDAPASWNNLKLKLEAVPLGEGAPPAGTHVPVGNATIFTVVNGIITSRTRLPGPTAPAATRDLPAPHPAPAADDTLPDIKLDGLHATVQVTQRPALDTSI